MSAVELLGLGRRFGGVAAVRGLSFAVPRGELFGLVGPDGAGKTTTLRMLAGILAPSEGDATVAGFSVAREPERVKSRIAYMSQRFGLYGDLTVIENLRFYADLFEVPARERPARFERLLGFSNLTPFQDRLADHLSGGMKQKLGLACALVHTPEVVLLDEPTNGVDPVSRRDFWRILQAIRAEGVTVLVSTAYLDEAERCGRVALLHQGRVLALDAPSALKSLLPGERVEIETERAWAAKAVAAAVPGVRDATVYGQRLRIGVTCGERCEARVMGALRAAGFAPREARAVEPSLEDVFISLVEGSRSA